MKTKQEYKDSIQYTGTIHCHGYTTTAGNLLILALLQCITIVAIGQPVPEKSPAEGWNLRPPASPSEPNPQVAISSNAATDEMIPIAKVVCGASGTASIGYVKPGSHHKILFRLQNNSDRLLSIRSVKSECRCMHISKYPKLLPPQAGEDVIVDAEFENHPLFYSKRVILISDDPQRPIISLIVQADVGLPLITEPSLVDLGQVQPGTHTTEVKIINRGKDPIGLVSAAEMSGVCTADISSSQLPGNSSLSIPLKVIVSPRPGRYSVNMHIITNHPLQKRLNLMVMYEVPGKDSQKTSTLTPEQKDSVPSH